VLAAIAAALAINAGYVLQHRRAGHDRADRAAPAARRRGRARALPAVAGRSALVVLRDEPPVAQEAAS
jgi:hypothetical protein